MVNSDVMKWKRICVENKAEIDLDNLVLNIVDDDLVEEGAGKSIAFSVLAFLLSSAGIVEGATFRREAQKYMKDKQVERGKVTVTKSELKDIVDKSKVPTKRVGRWTEAQAKNIIARTLYSEARGDKKTGMDMVMTVIWNRGAQDLKHLADEFLYLVHKSYQHQCIKDVECRLDIVFASYCNVLFWLQFLSKVAAQYSFVPHFCIQCCLASNPVDVAAGLHSIDVCLMKVLTKTLVPNQFKIGNTVDARVLELVVEAGAVEGVGPVGFLRETELPIQAQLVVLEIALVEQLAFPPFAVVGASITSASSSADAVVDAFDTESHASISLYGSKAAALNAYLYGLAFIVFGNDVDGSAKALPTVNAAGCTFQNLDALNVADVYWEVCGKMTCLWIADVDTV